MTPLLSTKSKSPLLLLVALSLSKLTSTFLRPSSPTASVEDRVADLIPRMNLAEKVSQMCVQLTPSFSASFSPCRFEMKTDRRIFTSLIFEYSTQGDFKRYINLSNTDLEYNATALALEMATRGGQQWSESSSRSADVQRADELTRHLFRIAGTPNLMNREKLVWAIELGQRYLMEVSVASGRRETECSDAST